MKAIKVKAKSIFTKTKLPGPDWAINPYVGCGHGCLYCYAKFMARWGKRNSYGRWGQWVEAKINAPELAKDKKVGGWVFMSSVSDPYQPVEKELKLTRGILENLDKSTKLSILTKSDLVLRDIDLLKQFKNAEVGLTINGFDGLLKFFEPQTPSNEQRIKALQKLRQNSIKTYAFISPIIPGLIDLRAIIEKTRKFVDYFWFEFLNLRGAGREFGDILQKKFPASFAILRNKKLFDDFSKECQKIIESSGVKVRGIERH
ncbi:MAG: radical SAM protein [Patescibacteria group bacterium]|nr:radical SAM protein [Patescibacteria group bacterium]